MPSSWPRFTLALLPYSRLELPGWGRLLRVAGVTRSADGWEGAPTRIIRCKNHGFLMPLNLSNWSERLSYFLGRHHEVAIALFLQAAVRAGETFIDVGGNIGMITLHAAALVGPTGRVHTFEPNPVLVERLQKLIVLNDLHHVTLHAAGLSDAPGELTLRVLHDHPGQGTLGEISAADQSAVTQEYRVPVRVADDVLTPDLSGPATIKIDVEGYELHVLRGLRQTLVRLRPIVVSEVSGDYLRRAGTSVAELFAFMKSLGYAGYVVDAARRALRHSLRLLPTADPSRVVAENVAWLHPESPGFARLAEFVG